MAVTKTVTVESAPMPHSPRARAMSTPAGEPEPSNTFTTLVTYFVYLVALLVGIARDVFAWMTGRSRFFSPSNPAFAGFPPILRPVDSFYSRRLYYRIRDAWNRPLAGPPGATLDVLEREVLPGTTRLRIAEPARTNRCINLGSYNYLGMSGETWKDTCRDMVMQSLREFGPSSGGASPSEGGLTTMHAELERVVANFVGKEDAVVYSMGYGTNSNTIPCLFAKGSLIISDALNHTSIVNGARASGAVIRVFRHNDPLDLEVVLRDAIADGQPRTHLPWKKIIVMTEGIFSMEGEICALPGVVRACKKFKAFLYVDEAHSIGALGKTGRGVCEQTGVDPADVDILMGTFTKSFGGMGGYIAASKEVCDFLRANAGCLLHGATMAPVVCAQILASLRVITGEDGTSLGAQKLDAIKDNANYVRERLEDMGCEVLGDRDSPVIPLMLYIPSKIGLFSRMCFERNLAVVVVGFPAVPLNAARTRICISAAHTREQLDEALEKLEEIIDILKLRYKRSMFG